MKGIVCFLMIVAGWVFLSGCATLICTDRQEITFSSAPEGAHVRIDGMVKGVTPTSIFLKRKPPLTVILEKEGFEPYQPTLERKINGWTFNNFFLGAGCIIGFVVDAITGAKYRLEPEAIHATLVPLEPTKSGDGPSHLSRSSRTMVSQ